MLNKTHAGLALAISALAAGQVQAADFNFSGTIVNHNDVVQIDFVLNSTATNVKVWTDSFQSGANFDPVTAVWVKSGADYLKVGENDDNDTVAPGQTYFDSGLVFASLAAGDYKFTIARYPNFSSGSLLSNGFRFDAASPSPLAAGTGDWSVHLSGVDGATTTAVPEPQTWALMLGGLALGLKGRRRQRPH